MATTQPAAGGPSADGRQPGRAAVETGEPTLGELVSAASKDVSALVRAEIALAKRELAAEAKSAAFGSALFGAAGFLGLLAVILLSVAAAYGLAAAGIPRGFAFLIVAAVYLLVAGLAVLLGVRRFKKIGPPRHTVSSVRKTAEWARHPREAG